MDSPHLLSLAGLCEAASPDMQSALLEEVWEACAEASAAFRRFARAHCSGFGTNAGKFGSALEAHAFIDAAIMLVPEGCEWRLDSHYNMAGVFAYPVDPESGPYCVEYEGESSTPALALCAAALRASQSHSQTERAI